jgi:high-affinity K+ transport system ATPase subunit B
MGDFTNRPGITRRRSLNRFVLIFPSPFSQANFPATPVRQQTETTIPADILLVSGTCIVNEAMLSGESTPLLKESIQLLEGDENLDVDGGHKSAVLFSGTKVLQAGSGGGKSFIYIGDSLILIF